MAKKRKIPYRKCIVTQQMQPKKDLIRIVRPKDGELFVDPTGKKNGRGAYLTNDLDIIEEAEREKVLEKHFQTDVNPEIFHDLKAIATENADG